MWNFSFILTYSLASDVLLSSPKLTRSLSTLQVIVVLSENLSCNFFLLSIVKYYFASLISVEICFKLYELIVSGVWHNGRVDDFGPRDPYLTQGKDQYIIKFK